MIEEFMRAAKDGDLDALSLHPELVNIRNDGAAALHVAALEGQLDAVRWLLENGAALDIRDDEFGMTPAAWANEKGRQAIVDFLLSQGAVITPFEAAAFGKLDRLQAFAAADRSVLTREQEWGSVAHAACIWGRIDILEWLISEGLDLDRSSRQGFMPLEIAERQAADGRRHTPIVLDERKREIERDCARIAELLRGALHAS
ncbi:MAG: ankyrin repeat domain-containing protein [Bryobacteraceae bacterium]